MEEANLKGIIDRAYDESKRLIEGLNRKSQTFRNRYEHTLRVLNWAERIQAIEGGDMDVITLAVLFHDTGWSKTINHAIVGGEIVKKYLISNGVEAEFVQQVAWAARTHNLRDTPKEELPIENLIMMDADLLDEVGVMAIVWDAMSTAGEKDAGYLRVLEKCKKFLAKAIKDKSKIKTGAGMKFYSERLNFREEYLKQYKYELGVIEQLED
jgi:uncharacterized protein